MSLISVPPTIAIDSTSVGGAIVIVKTSDSLTSPVSESVATILYGYDLEFEMTWVAMWMLFMGFWVIKVGVVCVPMYTS